MFGTIRIQTSSSEAFDCFASQRFFMTTILRNDCCKAYEKDAACFVVSLTMLFQLNRLHSVEWEGDCEQWIGTDVKKAVVTYFKVLS